MAYRGTRGAAVVIGKEEDRPPLRAGSIAGGRLRKVSVPAHEPNTQERQRASSARGVEDVMSRVIALKIVEDGTSERGRNIRTIRELKEDMEGMCRTVFASLGRQQSENAYQRALKVELELRGVAVQVEAKISVTYKNVEISSRRVDLLLTLDGGSKAIVEMKAVQTITKGTNLHAVHQLQYYLDAFEVEHGFLVNFPHDAGFPPPSSDKFVFTQEPICGVNGPLSDMHIGGRKAARVVDEPEVVYFQRTPVRKV
ncbi:unnamed protein product [Scytosiphon promiscuus]